MISKIIVLFSRRVAADLLLSASSTDNNNDTMKTTKTTARTFDLAYFKAQVIKTRQFGHTYVHAGAPHEFQHGDIQFAVFGYGRSLQGGGKKYKVSATRDGKPVKTAELSAIA